MKYRINKGQEAVEFILITMLVFFGAFFVVLAFGNKMANFFTNDSSVAKSTSRTTNVISANTPLNYSPNYTTNDTNDNNKLLYDKYQQELASKQILSTSNIAGYDVAMNADGSATLIVGSQQLNLSKELIELQDIVMETSGSEGIQDLVKEAAYLVEKYASQYPEGSVPIEISFGTGSRNSVDAAFVGKAEVNTVAVKVGSNLVIIQKDQKCSYSSNWNPTGPCCTTHENASGVYRLEGSIDENNIFNAKVTSETISNVSGTYVAPIDTTNGIVLQDGKFKAENIEKYGNYSPDFKWQIDFDKPGSTFKL
ncbi:MAG: hypothetical protein AB1782_11865 [Cyanobacteriota bacterium]